MYGIVPMTLSLLSMEEIPFCLKTIGKLLLNCTVTFVGVEVYVLWCCAINL